MNKNNTRHSDATPERAMGETAFISTVNSSIDQSTRQLKVADYLGNSLQTAITGRKLGEAMGIDTRTVQALIERERRSGALIIADSRRGYWLTTDPDEARDFAQRMKRRAKEIIQTARAIERSARNV